MSANGRTAPKLHISEDLTRVSADLTKDRRASQKREAVPRRARIKADRLLCHSALGSRVIKKQRRRNVAHLDPVSGPLRLKVSRVDEAIELRRVSLAPLWF